MITQNPQLSGDQKAAQIAQRQAIIQSIVEQGNRTYRAAHGEKQ